MQAVGKARGPAAGRAGEGVSVYGGKRAMRARLLDGRPEGRSEGYSEGGERAGAEEDEGCDADHCMYAIELMGSRNMRENWAVEAAVDACLGVSMMRVTMRYG